MLSMQSGHKFKFYENFFLFPFRSSLIDKKLIIGKTSENKNHFNLWSVVVSASLRC